MQSSSSLLSEGKERRFNNITIIHKIQDVPVLGYMYGYKLLIFQPNSEGH